MRTYLSNIRKAWPFKRQEALLDDEAPGWRSGPVYIDDVPPRKRMGHGPADLLKRVSLVRRTSRASGETVAVASLSILAWSTADLFTALAAIAARGDILWAIAEDVRVPPDAGAEVISQAAEAFLSAMHKAEGIGPAKGGRISGERREAEAKAKCELIRERWSLPNKEHPTKWLLAEVDVARATAIKHLGKRDEVQRKYAASLAAAERNRARRKTP